MRQKDMGLSPSRPWVLRSGSGDADKVARIAAQLGQLLGARLDYGGQAHSGLRKGRSVLPQLRERFLEE